MSTVPAARTALEVYEKTGELVIPSDLTHNDFSVWKCIFAGNLKGWREIAIEETRRNIRDIQDQYTYHLNKDSMGTFYSISILLAIGDINKYAKNKEGEFGKLFKELHSEIAKMWVNSLIDPNWGVLLKQHAKKYGPESIEVIEEAYKNSTPYTIDEFMSGPGSRRN